jgi:hypothetical protein
VALPRRIVKWTPICIGVPRATFNSAIRVPRRGQDVPEPGSLQPCAPGWNDHSETIPRTVDDLRGDHPRGRRDGGCGRSGLPNRRHHGVRLHRPEAHRVRRLRFTLRHLPQRHTIQRHLGVRRRDPHLVQRDASKRRHAVGSIRACDGVRPHATGHRDVWRLEPDAGAPERHLGMELRRTDVDAYRVDCAKRPSRHPDDVRRGRCTAAPFRRRRRQQALQRDLAVFGLGVDPHHHDDELSHRQSVCRAHVSRSGLQLVDRADHHLRRCRISRDWRPPH